MKKALIALLLVAMLLSAVPVFAESFRANRVISNLNFNGTIANCSASIFAATTKDRISATMELWQGSTLIDSWSSTGRGSLNLSKTANVSLKKTYILTVKTTVNGVALSPVSVSKTNN